MSIQIRKASADDFELILTEIDKNFIYEERREREKEKELLLLNAIDAYVFYKDDNAVGFINAWNFSDFVFFEHFVIFEKYRNCGYGTEAVLLLKNRFKRMILEVEPGENELKRRRIEFYKRAGFVENDFDYIQPSYHGGDGIILRLLSYPERIFDRKETVSAIYETVYNVHSDL